MPTDWTDRQREREERVEELTRQHVRRLRGDDGESGFGLFARRARKTIGAGLFVALLVGGWWIAPKLGLWGSNARTDAEIAVDERLDELGEDLRREVQERTGVEIAPPTADLTQGDPTDGWALPLARIDAERAGRPHHDYPAWDYGTPVGSAVYAMTAGTITTALDDDGARCGGTVSITTHAEDAQITYCHLSGVLVDQWQDVEPGDLIGLTGGDPGAPGAGNTSGPHLHLQIRLDGELHCPQAALLAMAEGTSLPVQDMPTTGCFYAASGFSESEVRNNEGSPFFLWD